MWENGNYGLMLMDVQMPLMNGFEATAAKREKEHTHSGHIPILAMTAHAFKEDKQRCLDADMDAYISFHGMLTSDKGNARKCVIDSVDTRAS